jgi:hypothetical protein
MTQNSQDILHTVTISVIRRTSKDALLHSETRVISKQQSRITYGASKLTIYPGAADFRQHEVCSKTAGVTCNQGGIHRLNNHTEDIKSYIKYYLQNRNVRVTRGHPAIAYYKLVGLSELTKSFSCTICKRRTCVCLRSVTRMLY